MKYSIHMNGREFLLMRDKTEIAVLEIGPDKTLEEARQMVADLNSIDAMRQMLCAEQAENATLRAERDLWEAKAKELIAPHYILDPDLRAAKFRDALAFHPVIFVRAALRAELLKATGSLGLLTAGANPKAEGHKANLESARNILCATATPDELVCPTCKSARWAEIHPSKSDPTGYTLYCRRCEEGCVTPARAALVKESP
jgi:hypothetical protein